MSPGNRGKTNQDVAWIELGNEESETKLNEIMQTVITTGQTNTIPEHGQIWNRTINSPKIGKNIQTEGEHLAKRDI